MKGFTGSKTRRFTNHIGKGVSYIFMPFYCKKTINRQIQAESSPEIRTPEANIVM